RIGMDGLAGPLDPDGWLPHSVYQRLVELMPKAELVNLDDMLESLRTVKSAEEIGILEQAAKLGDLMLTTCRDTARTGVKESEVYGSMIHTMLANGGEEPTLFLWACDRYPAPHPFRLPTVRAIERGDLITCEIHPKIGGYFTHVERTFSIGAPEAEQRRIYDGCVKALHEGMKLFGAGRSILQAVKHGAGAMPHARLGMCETRIPRHGLASLEYPRYRHHAIKADQEALKITGDEFRTGMVFAFNIDLFDPKYHAGNTGCVFAETVHITDNGPRRMHSYPMVFQELAA